MEIPAERAPRDHQWWVALPLVFLSAVAVSPSLFRLTGHIVDDTYSQAAIRIWQGISPYSTPVHADQFKYGPIFAVLYFPFTWLSFHTHALLWAAANALIYWVGLLRWVNGKPQSWGLTLLILVLASLELDGSLRYLQVNAALVGLILIGLADSRDGKEFRAGFVLALASVIKVLPALFAVTLLLPIRRRYLLGLVAGGLLALMMPALVVGPSAALNFHLEWIQLLRRDVGGPGLLDVETILAKAGLPIVGHWVRLFILIASVGIMIGMRLRKDFPRHWTFWIAVGLSAILLTSPRTESPTFVLIGPVIAMLLLSLVYDSGARRTFGLAVFGLAVFLISLVYNDVWPRAWHPPTFACKTIGTGLIWVLAVYLVLDRTIRFRPAAQ